VTRLRIIILGTAILLIPLAFYVASQYGDIENVTFEQAIETTVTNVEGDQAPKVIIITSITATRGEEVYGEDRTGRSFRVDYTGKPPAKPFSAGETVRFVGHVHMSEDAYFHATQVYGE
jgi:hypothetical protein